MVDEKITTVAELYKRVMPALKSKRRELSSRKLNCISENMIWNCLKETKWTKGRVTNLTLYDVVNDIFAITESELITYLSELDKRKKA